MGALLYGTSSWSEPTWLGTFYPEGLPARDWLAHYARSFRSVEADVTYYRVPSATMVRGWRDRTPEDFVLAAKFPRAIVHRGRGPTPQADEILRPRFVAAETDMFLEALGSLGEKCGPLVLQLPYFNRAAFAEPGPFLELLDAYLASLPSAFRYAVEVRNKDWIGAPLLDLLRRHRTALVWTDLVYMPHPARLARTLDLVTTDFLYARLIGDRKAVDAVTERYDRVVVDRSDRLERWVTLLQETLPKVARGFLYANNHYAGHAPATLRQLMTLMGDDPPPPLAPPPPPPTQGSLPFDP